MYADFIDSCRFKTPISGEWHHIIPRSEGGSDDSSNLIFLSHSDHIRAHYIFACETGRCWKALWFMLAQTHGTLSRMDPKEREALFEEHAAMREKAQRARRGPLSDKHKASMSASLIGKPKTSEHRIAISKARHGQRRDRRVCRWQLANEEIVATAYELSRQLKLQKSSNLLGLIERPDRCRHGVRWLQTMIE